MTAVTPVDWMALGLVGLAALAGLGKGLVASALSAVGIVSGAIIGARLAPYFLGGDDSPYTPLIGLVGAVAGALVLETIASLVGSQARAALRLSPLRVVDSAGGFVLGALVGLVIVWVLGAVALHTPGQRELRRAVQRSVVLQRLNEVAPPSRLMEAIQRVDPFPAIVGPLPPTEPPDPRLVRDPDVRSAAESVVRVVGTACGLAMTGSGWVGRPGLVVTNAHVVAGQEDTRVLLRGRQPGLDAHAVAFDSRNDLAILRVPGLEADALTLASNPRSGTSAAILGFPGNGPYDVRAGRIGGTREVITQDAYGQGPVRRSITSLRGAVRSGNSGGPMVDKDGQVVTTIFAATTSGPRGGFGVPNAIVRPALERAARSGGVSTGPCTG